MEDLPSRKTIRLPYFDYGNEACYFVTICSADSACIFGRIVDDVLEPTPVGRMVDWRWQAMAQARPYVKLDAFVVMPNHLHGLLKISQRQTPAQRRDPNSPLKMSSFGPLRPGSLPSIIGVFKSFVTRNVRADGLWTAGSLWQERYHDHLVRSAESLTKIREYIRLNPKRWNKDRWNAAADGADEFDTWLEEEGKKPLAYR